MKWKSGNRPNYPDAELPDGGASALSSLRTASAVVGLISEAPSGSKD
ncbi:hypothetical protein SIN_02430 [Salmonella enterica subsp. enterica serovar Infantis]|nr:hypothetical protein SIN_02430 [Salmonella enterica subsp. enterica serovar Infantis]VXG76447.1 hypothetical protein CDS [Salmonella enterica subsp. enterica serovar Derby]